MFSYSIITIIISASVGLIAGYVVGYKLKFPRSQKMFWLTIFFLFFSPFVGVQTYLIGDSTSGTLHGLAVAPFLFSFFLMLNVLYIFRQVTVNLRTDTNKLAR